MNAAAPLIAANPRIAQWIGLSEPGVVRAFTGRVELGQGTTLALTGAVAAALSVDPARVRLVAGDTRACPDEGYTAGSRSIEAGGVALRGAARAARALLLDRARALLQNPAGALTVDDGAVLLDGAATGLDLWRLAAEGPFDGPIGDPDPGPDPAPGPVPDLGPLAAAGLRARIRGGGFIHDLALPRMRHARLLSPPFPAARLLGADDAAIAALPGVLSVVRDGAFLAVVATDEWAAVRAADRAARHVRWSAPENASERAPDPADLLQAHAGPEETMIARGAAPDGGRVVSVEAARPFLAHASLGPCCAVAEWDGARLTVRSHTQGPHALRAALAAALALDEAAVDVVHVPGAGCYGHNGADDVAFDAALIARACPGAPVRLLWSRAEEFSRGPLAAAMRTRATATLDAGGRIAAVALDILSAPHQQRPGPGKLNFAAGPMLARPVPHAPAVEPPPAGGGGADRNADPLYALPAVTVRRRIATAIPVRTSALRSLGAYLNVVAIEGLMDAVADAIGRDPLDVRRDHLDDPRARAVLDRAAAMAGWGDPRPEGVGLGVGLARYKNKAGWCAVCAEVAVDEAATVRRLWAAADVGEVFDPEGVRAQIEGGMLQALSWTLIEEARLGEGLSPPRAWADYPVLTFADAPAIDVALIDRPDAPPLGAGEIAQGPTGAAIVGAVARALGVALTDLPLSRERLMQALLDA
jgi:nicotinate dehydrogenase subunit B